MSSFNFTEYKGSNSSFFLPEGFHFFMFILLISLSLFGIVANIVNMITFWKLRKDDPINVNLFGLALSDFFVCLTTTIFSVTTGKWYMQEMMMRLKFNPISVGYFSVGILHSTTVRITVLLTTCISFQRCLCVCLPLKVKGLFTRSRITSFVVICFIFPPLFLMIPIYYANRLVWITNPVLNLTILDHAVTEDFFSINAWHASTTIALFLVLPFLTVLVSTVIMMNRLKQTMSWRLQVAEGGGAGDSKSPKDSSSGASSSKKDAVIQKEKRIVKLVVSMSTVFLICYAPNIASDALYAYTSFLRTKRDDTPLLIRDLGWLLDTINSSINIVIYLRFSTNYRTTFKAMFNKKGSFNK